ncbi:MAG TPA: hypothetical protein VEA59_02275 [Patescibacteria group bacterium]|nr:hypothetical protein [Patescibacteria group bacterium]
MPQNTAEIKEKVANETESGEQDPPIDEILLNLEQYIASSFGRRGGREFGYDRTFDRIWNKAKNSAEQKGEEFHIIANFKQALEQLWDTFENNPSTLGETIQVGGVELTLLGVRDNRSRMYVPTEEIAQKKPKEYRSFFCHLKAAGKNFFVKISDTEKPSGNKFKENRPAGGMRELIGSKVAEATFAEDEYLRDKVEVIPSHLGYDYEDKKYKHKQRIVISQYRNPEDGRSNLATFSKYVDGQPPEKKNYYGDLLARAQSALEHNRFSVGFWDFDVDNESGRRMLPSRNAFVNKKTGKLIVYDFSCYLPNYDDLKIADLQQQITEQPKHSL